MDIQSMAVGIAIGIVAVPVLVGLFKSLKNWPRNTIGTVKAIGLHIKG